VTGVGTLGGGDCVENDLVTVAVGFTVSGDSRSLHEVDYPHPTRADTPQPGAAEDRKRSA
jgi:hypothetical protein